MAAFLLKYLGKRPLPLEGVTCNFLLKMAVVERQFIMSLANLQYSDIFLKFRNLGYLALFDFKPDC